MPPDDAAPSARGLMDRACGTRRAVSRSLPWLASVLAGAALDANVRDRCCDVAVDIDGVMDRSEARDSKLKGCPIRRRAQSVPRRRRFERLDGCLGMERR